MMTTVKLGGVLGREFGYVWHLDIDRPAEAIRAIDANRPGLQQRILDLAEAGIVYRVRVAGRPIDGAEFDVRSGGQSITIMPIVRGAGANARIVVGAVIVAAAYYFGGPAGGYAIGTAAQTAGYGIGASMIIGGVIQMLTPTASLGSNNSSRNSAYTFGNTDNVSGQGFAIPVGYGRCLVGSVVVDAALVAEDMGAYSSSNPTLQQGA